MGVRRDARIRLDKGGEFCGGILKNLLNGISDLFAEGRGGGGCHGQDERQAHHHLISLRKVTIGNIKKNGAFLKNQKTPIVVSYLKFSNFDQKKSIPYTWAAKWKIQKKKILCGVFLVFSVMCKFIKQRRAE